MAYRATRYPYPTQTSNMFEPMLELTAISPRPFLATITLVIKSGIDVPAARIVSPITLISCFNKCQDISLVLAYLGRYHECLANRICPPDHQVRK